ncbi:DUF4855 domain-containing protein [Rossellomorea oryzaecorticis]|uniref:DUF4855 domain-containing protein n=1 Tax=Rossellomorea oryzaecorticis TaxID=1396505 RepID=A0ABW8VLP1_9BACI
MRNINTSKLVIVLLSLFLLQSHVTSAKRLYTDLPSDYWAFKEIRYLSSKDVIKGYDDQSFKAGLSITRKQAAMMLSRALGLEAKDYDTQMDDVKTYTSGYDDIHAAVESGIIHTYGTKFLPDALFTREDMAKALTLAFDFEGSGASTYSDVPYTYRYYKYIDGLAASNITKGYTDGTFRPKSPVTRAQFSAFLGRVFLYPQRYEVRQGDEIIYTSRDPEQAIDKAASMMDATVHPVNDTLNKYDEVPSSQSSSIRNGVLIYNGNEINNYTNLTKDFFKPYLSYLNEGTYQGTMFDTFILLGRTYEYGEFTESPKNHANYGDWNWYIDRTLSPGGAVDLLNQSVEELPHIESTNVFLSIPYPKKYENIINLDGRMIENNLESRFSLVKWYIDEALSRKSSGGYENVQVNGFYWLNETVTNKEDEELLEMVSSYVKSKNLKFIYSPHALSTNYDYWKWYGFDGAFLQSNAHKMKLSEDEVRRLIHKAFLRAQTRNSGLNLEIENHSNNTIYQGLDNFRIYLEIAKLYNLPGKSFIMYQGTEMIHRLATFDTPHHRQMYDELYQFLNYKK